jgi:DNA-binding LacI/PurR family transcriptional regulator
VPTIEPSSPKHQAKLEDVARLAGVAKSTVSRVLIGEKTLSIRAETRERVLEAVRTLGYRPDMRARSLRTKRSFSLGLVVPEIDNPAFNTIIQGAQRAALERNYSLLVAYVDKHYPDRELYRRLVNDNQVGGLLVTTIQNPRLTQDLKELGVHHVLVNRELGNGEHTVIVDYEGGTSQAVQYLSALGHRRIGYVSGPAAHYTGRKRLAGFQAGLADAGIAFDPARVAECDYDRAGAEVAIQRLLAHPDGRPTALCTANVAIAAAVLAIAARQGLTVPRDLSVIALLDGPVAEMLTPAITAVRYPSFELGQLAANDLIDIIEGTAPAPAPRILPAGGIVLRQSTAPPV